MNALKHMELIFAAVLALACVVAFLPGGPGQPAMAEAARASVPVVVVTGKRMTALEKRQSRGTDTGARPTTAGS